MWIVLGICAIVFIIVLLLIDISYKVADSAQARERVEQLKEEEKGLAEANKLAILYKATITADCNKLKQEKEILDNYLAEKRNQINEVNLSAEQIQHKIRDSVTQYVDSLEASYKTKEREYDERCAALVSGITEMQSKYDEIKSELAQGAAAALREREKKEKINFYKLKLSDSDSIDIKELFELRKRFRNPSALSKLIWSEYFLKQTSELCNRILGTNTKCGIYKITNLVSNQAYIGQSVDIASRFKQHIKCGLGIDTPASNKLYKSMIEDGVWNFSFELLEECPKDKLNERESFWIDLYQTNKVGLNRTKGNG